MANAALQVGSSTTAIEACDHESRLPEQSYDDLQETVRVMAQELAVSRTVRRRDLMEKERLVSRLAWMLEALPSAILIIDGNGFIVEHNNKASELLNSPLLDCAWSVIVQREFCPGDSVNGELKLKNGRWLSLARQWLDSEPGEILVLTDITESRERSEMLQRHHRLSCMGEMTARLGHQLKTPLASALLYASQLDDPDSSKRKHATEKVVSRLQDLAQMMEDILGYAAGARQSGEAVMVADLIASVVETIRPQLDSSDQLAVDAIDPLLAVEVNVTAMKGALLNLVNNAFQACDDDPRVELGAVELKDQIYLTVTDNGAGVSDDIRTRIFEPFFTTRPQGTGLGLAVARSVAEAHGGEILVECTPAGTTFAVRLPAPESVSMPPEQSGESGLEIANV